MQEIFWKGKRRKGKVLDGGEEKVSYYVNRGEGSGMYIYIKNLTSTSFRHTLENELKISTRPLSWPINMGSRFKGVYLLHDNTLNLFEADKTKKAAEYIEINDLKDQNGFWVPITYRTRIIVYSKDRVSKEELSTYEDLANEIKNSHLGI